MPSVATDAIAIPPPAGCGVADGACNVVTPSAFETIADVAVLFFPETNLRIAPANASPIFLHGEKNASTRLIGFGVRCTNVASQSFPARSKKMPLRPVASDAAEPAVNTAQMVRLPASPLRVSVQYAKQHLEGSAAVA